MWIARCETAKFPNMHQLYTLHPCEAWGRCPEGGGGSAEVNILTALYAPHPLTAARSSPIPASPARGSVNALHPPSFRAKPRSMRQHAEPAAGRFGLRHGTQLWPRRFHLLTIAAKILGHFHLDYESMRVEFPLTSDPPDLAEPKLDSKSPALVPLRSTRQGGRLEWREEASLPSGISPLTKPVRASPRCLPVRRTPRRRR